MVLGFVNPLFYKIFIDDVILNGQFNKMFVVAGGYLGIFGISILIEYLKNYANYKLVNTTLYRVKLKIWQGFLKLPFAVYETSDIGDMKMRLDDDSNQVGNFASYQTIDYLISYVTLVISLVLLFIIDWRLALFSVITIPLTFWVDHLLSKRESNLNNSNRENDQKMSTWLHSSVQGWREIRTLNLEKSQERQFVRFLHNFALYFGKWINYWTARVLVIPKIKDEFLMQFGLYFVGGLLIMNGELKISNLLLFAMYYGVLSNAVQTVSSTDAELQSSEPYVNRLLESINKEDCSAERGIIPDDTNVIELKDVSFTYHNNEKEIVSGLNLRIGKGEHVAITGKSGGGKTTLLKLITGMVEPTSGAVYFSGISLRDINLEVMHSRIGFIMQENVLFNTTIRENLLYGKENASELELRDACERACILSLIEGLPDGFESIIGERGIKLSGGERQRIVLARLFLRNVDIFIFDEATSALDQYSENIIYDTIKKVTKDKTIIIVSHRESSIELCDRQIKM